MEYVTIFGRPFPIYGLCVLAGILLAAATILVRGRKEERDLDFLTFLCACVGLYVGAKLLYLITIAPRLIERPELLRDPEFVESIVSGGFVFYGGLIGAVAGIAIYCRAMKRRFLAVLDTLIPCAAIGQAAGRVGCHLVGCCYGVPYSGPLAVTYPVGEHVMGGIPLFPVQLAESALLVVIYIVLMLLGRRREGFASGLYLVCSAVTRFLLEFARGDAERGIFLGLATSQWIALLILLPLGIFLIARSARRKGKET
jgi:phosphatidylglycerol:prolipoprotein diacylglycerol transferase